MAHAKSDARKKSAPMDLCGIWVLERSLWLPKVVKAVPQMTQEHKSAAPYGAAAGIAF